MSPIPLLLWGGTYRAHRQGSTEHTLRAEPVEPSCENPPKPIQSVLSVPFPFLPSHVFHHDNSGQQTSDLVRQSVGQVMVYTQGWISLCKSSGSWATESKFSSHLTSLNMHGLEMLGWLLLAQFCWNAILSRQQREEGSGASTLWPSGHVCDSWKITADRESEQDIIKQEISYLGHKFLLPTWAGHRSFQHPVTPEPQLYLQLCWPKPG